MISEVIVLIGITIGIGTIILAKKGMSICFQAKAELEEKQLRSIIRSEMRRKK